MHVNTLIDRFAELPNVEWVACADTVPDIPTISDQRGTRVANVKRGVDVTGIPKVYEDYRDMLDKEKFDVVIFCPENSRHGEVAEAIAAVGSHMVTEKPMSSSLSDALRMVRAAKAAGVQAIVNWPSTWQSAMRKGKELVDQGAIGRVWEIKRRNGASMGPLAHGQALTDTEKGAEWWHHAAPGGGALLDYCCYGACQVRWYIGEPAVSVSGVRANMTSHYGDADDNAVLTVRFPSALAILEGTWSTVHVGVPLGPVIYGTEGTMVITRRVVDGQRMGAVEVYTSPDRAIGDPNELIEGGPLPEGRETLSKEIFHHLETGEPLHPTLQMDFNLEAMAILDAGIRSSISGKVELVNDVTWCIG